MRRSLFLLLIVCPLLLGCLFPWVIPTVTHMPPVTIETTDRRAEIQAFQCNVTTRHIQFLGGGQKHVIGMEEVKFDRDATTPRKIDGGLNRGVIGIIGLKQVYHSSCLKLFRDGYATVVLGPKDDHKHIRWVKLNNTEEEFQAIRDFLLALPEMSATVDPKQESIPSFCMADGMAKMIHPRLGWDRREPNVGTLAWEAKLRPASSNEAHRECLLFAKGKCESLLEKRQPDDELRKKIEYQIARIDEILVQ